MLRDKNFYKTFAILTLSIALQNLLTYSVNLMDNLMLGSYTETALSGASLCNQIQYLLQMIVFGASEGIVVMGTQYWGKGELKPITDIIGVALRYTVGFSAAVFLVVSIWPEWTLGLLATDADVVAAGAEYLRIVKYSYVIYAISGVLASSLRSIGIVKIGYITSAITLCIKTILNYCLIFGNFGFPALGIEGAAIATLVSRTIELLIAALYLKYKEKRLDLTLKRIIKIDRSYIKDYSKVSLPIIANQAQWGTVEMIQTSILGHLGCPEAIAANSIAVVVMQMIAVVAFGASGAASILVGKTVGECKEERLHQIVRSLMIIFIVIGILTGIAIYLVRYPVLKFYNISPEARELALQFMAVIAICTVGTAIHVPMENGIVRGGGDTSFSAIMNLISMWVIVIPISLLVAFKFHAAPAIVFFCLKSDQIFKILPLAIRVRSWKWVRKVTRKEDTACIAQ